MKRIKHLSKPKGETKYIRINDKTLIEVDVNMPEETARELYLHKFTLNKPVGKQVQENRHLMKN
jgi:ActR/RegA family two-component response regulator